MVTRKMNMRIWGLTGILVITVWLLGLALATEVGTATAQQAPTETKGVTVNLLAAVDLGPEVSGMQGRQLRLRIVTVKPSGVMGVHSHKNRPGAAYVIMGAVIEHRGDVVKTYIAGDSWAEDGNVTHWLENKETSPAVLIATDIFKQH